MYGLDRPNWWKIHLKIAAKQQCPESAFNIQIVSQIVEVDTTCQNIPDLNLKIPQNSSHSFDFVLSSSFRRKIWKNLKILPSHETSEKDWKRKQSEGDICKVISFFLLAHHASLHGRRVSLILRQGFYSRESL